MSVLICKWMKTGASRSTVVFVLLTLAVIEVAAADQVRDYIYLGSKVIGSTDATASGTPTGWTPTPTFVGVPAPTATPDPRPKGSIDLADCAAVQGWACDPSNYSVSILVNVFADGALAGQAVADAPRGDMPGVCGGYPNHAFAYLVPSSLKNGIRHVITAEGVNIDLSGTVVGSGNGPLAPATPTSIQCSGGPTATATATATASPTATATPRPTATATPTVDPQPFPIGALDVGDCAAIQGWACDASNFSLGLYVHIYADGTFVDQTVATAPRADLPGVCGGNGNHAFAYLVPGTLKDGQAHTITAYGINIDAAGAVVGIGNSPLPAATPVVIQCAPTPTPRPTATSTSTATATVTSGATATITPRPTVTVAPRPTLTPTSTSTATATVTPRPTATSTSTPAPTPTWVDVLPKGNQDVTNCSYSAGWACDPNNYSLSVQVHFYTDGNVFIGATTAAGPRSDLPAVCGGYATHAFSFNIPTSLKDGHPHNVYAYVINIDPSGNPVGSGNVQLPPQPAITCTP